VVKLTRKGDLEPTWNVGLDIQNIMAVVESSKTLKTVMRVVFVGEDHYLLYDQQRRNGVLKELRSSTKFFFTVLERGLKAPTEGVPNVLWENSRMDASFAIRNAVTTNVIEDTLKDAHLTTVPDLVFFFGQNHETSSKGDAIQDELLRRIDKWKKDKVPVLGDITEVEWTLAPSADYVIKSLPKNTNWDKLVVAEPANLLGCVRCNLDSIDHNMVLAEKCLVKQMFQVALLPEKEAPSSYWKLYIRRTGRMQGIFKGIDEGDRDFAITSLNPSHMLKAVRHGT
jgi:hypothetical protein